MLISTRYFLIPHGQRKKRHGIPDYGARSHPIFPGGGSPHASLRQNETNVLLFRMLSEDDLNVETAVRKLDDFQFHHFTGKRVAQSFPNFLQLACRHGLHCSGKQPLNGSRTAEKQQCGPRLIFPSPLTAHPPPPAETPQTVTSGGNFTRNVEG
jgi:hypothetical protein